MNFNERAERIRAANRARKEAERAAKIKSPVDLKPAGIGQLIGLTASGKQAVFTRIEFGMTEVSRWAGTLTIDGKTMFTRGYVSRALEVMAQN